MISSLNNSVLPSATWVTQSQKKALNATRTSWLRDISIGILPNKSKHQFSTKGHELLQYLLENVVDCPVGSRFIVCICANTGDLEHGKYHAERATYIVSKFKCVENVWQMLHCSSGWDWQQHPDEECSPTYASSKHGWWFCIGVRR